MYRVHRNCTRCGATWSYWNNKPEPCTRCGMRNPSYRCNASRYEGRHFMCVGTMWLGMDGLMHCDKCGREAEPE